MDESVQDDGDIDVDNLFNEEALNNAALGEEPLSFNAILPTYVSVPAQTQYLADLTTSGSLNQLAWAKLGIIARIIEHGTAVELTGQRLDQKTSKWVSITPTLLECTFEDAVALAWGPSGGELVVLERKGRVHIFNLYPTALNKLAHSRTGDADQVNEASQPIGLLCLNLSRGENDKKKTVLENVKENGKWRHEHINGGHHPPHALRALCMVNRTGTFTLLYTRDASPYKTATLSLPLPDGQSTYTHAAIAQTPEGYLLVALHAIDGDISAYFVNILFSPAEPVASLSATVLDLNIPAVPPYFNLESHVAPDMMTGSLLTHLHILPESEYSWDHLVKPHLPQKQPATLVAIYSSYNNQKNAAGESFFGTTVMKRWQFQRLQFELHPRFGSDSTNQDTGEVVMHPLQDVVLPAPVTNMQLVEPGNALAITTLDGSTSFWDPDSMTPIMSDPSSEVVSSVGQINLDFPQLIMSSMQCISPHGLVLAYTNVEGELHLAKPHYRDHSVMKGQYRELDMTNPLDEALVANYILSFSRSCWQQNSTLDDILSSIRNTVAPQSVVHIRRQLFTTLFEAKTLVPGASNVSELDKVPHLIIVYKALAFTLGLYPPWLSQTQSMSVVGNGTAQVERIAYLHTFLVLNLRWSIAIIGDTYKSMHQPPAAQNPQNPQQRPPQPPILPPTFLDLVSHNVRWVFALNTFILQTLLDIHDRSIHPEMFDSPDYATLLGDANGDGTQGLVALLLNCNWSRSLLLILSRLFKAISARAGVSVNFNNGKQSTSVPGHLASSTLGRIAHTIQQCSLQYGISVNALELFYDQRWHPDLWDDKTNAATLAAQIEMLITGHVSEAYQGTIKNLIDNCINGDDGLRARGEIDRLRIAQETPERSFVLLNMDDIAFKDHSPTMSVDARANGINGWHGETGVDARNHGTTAGKPKPQRLLYDVHKKLPLFSHQSLALVPVSTAGQVDGLPMVTSTAEMLEAQARRCVRCGSLSDGMVDGINKSWPRQIMQWMNKCVCDGGWVVESVGEGLIR